MLKTFVLSFLCKIGIRKKHSIIGYRQWIRAVLKNFAHDEEYTIREKLASYKLGFLPQTVKFCEIDKDNYFKYISQRDFLQIAPAVKKSNRWLKNAVIKEDVYRLFSQYYPSHALYCKKNKDVLEFFSFTNQEKTSIEEIASKLRTAEAINILDVGTGKLTRENTAGVYDVIEMIKSHMKSRWAIISEEELNINESFLVYAYKEKDKEACIGSVLKRKQGEDGKYKIIENISNISDLNKIFLNRFDELETNIINFLNKRKQVSLVVFEFMKTNHAVRLIKIMRKPQFPVFCCFDDTFNDYLRTLIKKNILSYRTRKRGKIIKKISHIFLNLKELLLVGKGFTPRNAKKWILKKYVDNKLMCAEGRTKLFWAHRHGFTCETMRQNKINKDNYKKMSQKNNF